MTLHLVEPTEGPVNEAQDLRDAVVLLARIERSTLLPKHAQRAVEALNDLVRRYVDRLEEVR